jgi:ferredoxin
MTIKNVFAVYFSPTGTTRKAISAFARGMGLRWKEIDLTLPENRQIVNQSFTKDDLLVAGLPVYGGRLPKNLDNFFSGLTGNGTPAVALVMYGNREYDDALIELKLRLEEKGFVVKAGAAFIGEHSFSEKIATGRPDARDLTAAADFGRKTIESINKGLSGKLNLKGNFPFVKKGYDPAIHLDFPPHPRIVTTESCTQCQICSQNCPWGAINPSDCKIRDYSKCLLCFRCLKNCPEKAIQATGEKWLEYLPQFEKRLNAQRKEPELFLPD